MQKIADKLHLHRKQKNPTAPAPASDPLKPTLIPLNAQGQPISTTTPLAATTPSTVPLGKDSFVQQPSLQQPLQSNLQQNNLQQRGFQQQPLQSNFQQSNLQQPAFQQGFQQQQSWQQGSLPTASLQKPGLQQQGFQQSGIQNAGFQQAGLQQPVFQQSGLQQTGLQQQGFNQAGLQSITRPPIVETIVRPTRIDQTTRLEKVVEVQPVIHRNIDAPEIRIIEQHSYESQPLGSPAVITNPTIVEEIVKPRIIEEVQPVIHREVPVPVINKVEQHITENVSQPAITNKVVQQQSNIATIQQPVARALPVQQAQPIVRSMGTTAAITESRTAPTIVEQTAVPEKIVQVQPIIHRDIDAPQVRVIEKHMYEQVRSTGPSVVYRQPLVQEVVIPKIIEDIQPVVHREVPQIVVEHQEQHITEQVTQPATTVKQVLQDRAVKPLPAIPQAAKALPATPAVRSTTAAAVVENVMRPAIVEQTTRQEIIQEVQPIIHREIDTTEVRVIEQHSFERMAPTGPATINLTPVIEETVHPHIIEEIHPVVHRTVPAPFIERVEQHTQENITQPVVTTRQIVNAGTTSSVLEQQNLGLNQWAPMATNIPPAPSMPPAGFWNNQQGLGQRSVQQQGFQQNLGQQGFGQQGLNQGLRSAPPAPPLPPKNWNHGHFLQTQYRGLGQQGLGQQQGGFQQPYAQPGFQQGSQQPGFQQGLNQGFRSAPPAPPMPPKNWNNGHFLQRAQQNRLGQQNLYGQQGFQQPLSSFASPMMGNNLPQQSFDGQKAGLLSGGAIPQQAGGSFLQGGAPIAQPQQAGGAPRVSTKPAHKWLA